MSKREIIGELRKRVTRGIPEFEQIYGHKPTVLLVQEAHVLALGRGETHHLAPFCGLTVLVDLHLDQPALKSETGGLYRLDPERLPGHGTEAGPEVVASARKAKMFGTSTKRIVQGICRYMAEHDESPSALIVHPRQLSEFYRDAAGVVPLLDNVWVLTSPCFENPVLVDAHGNHREL